MELKQVYIKFLSNTWEEYKLSRQYTSSMYLKICLFSNTHFPLLLSDSIHHVQGYFTQTALNKFEKTYKVSLLDLFGQEIELIKWRLMLSDATDVKEDPVNEHLANEKYTSYMNKEVKLIIEEFRINKHDKLDELFSENLHWDPDIKLQIARIHHSTLQNADVYKQADTKVKVKKSDAKSLFTKAIARKAHLRLVDLEKKYKHHRVRHWKQNVSPSCFIDKPFLPPEFDSDSGSETDSSLQKVIKRKSKYFEKQLVTKIYNKSGSQLFSQQFKIRSTRSRQSVNYEGKLEEDICI